MSIPSIACSIENHYNMPFQYVCLHPHCLKNAQQLACIYCCQQLHKSHIQNIQAIKILLTDFQASIQSTEFGAAQILLKGVSKCRNQKQLSQNISQLICYKNGQKKFEKIIDRKNQVQKQDTKQFYQNRDNEKKIEDKTVKKNDKRKQEINRNFISPILTFSQDDAIEQKFQFKSPFCVVNNTEKLVTAFVYPPLNRFKESIETKVKIERITPFWLGVGVSIGRKKYQNQSKDHIIMTSNGWVSVLGDLQRTNVKYCLKDTVKVKYDKGMQLIQFICNGQKHTVPLQASWDQDLYLCCVLYYKDDCVQILA